MRRTVTIVFTLFLFVPALSHSEQFTGPSEYTNLLRAFKARDVGTMTEFLLSEDPKIRSLAARWITTLAYRGFPDIGQTVPSLVQVMLSDENSEVSGAAAHALGAIGGSEAEQALFDVIQTEENAHSHARAGAFIWLGKSNDQRIEDYAIEALCDSSSRVREAAVMALGELQSQKAVGTLIERLIFCYENPDTSELHRWGQVPFRSRLHDALRRIGEPAIPGLLILLEHDSKALREGVAVTLGTMGSKEAVPILIGILANKESAHRSSYIATVLGDLRDKRAIPVLIEALEDMTPDQGGCVINPLARPFAYAAYRALLGMGVKVKRIHRKGTFDLYEVVDGTPSDTALIRALSSKDKQQRYRAALKLGSEFYQGAIPVLMEMVTSAENWKDRLWAARHLGEIKDKRAIPALIQALEDESHYPDRDPWFLISARDSYRPIAAEAYQALKHLGVKVEMIIDSAQGTWEFHVIERNTTE